jgi:hypothetical protein
MSSKTLADQSPTSNKLIVTVGLLAVFTLVSLKFIIGSYYISMTEAEQHESISAPEQLTQLRAEQNKALQQSSVPIDVAMKNLATSGRDNAPPIITPQQSNDLGPLQGWSQLPHEVQQFAAPPPPTVPSTALATDGGVADGGHDGGAHATATDAGRPTPPTAPPPPPPAPNAAGDAGH